MSAWEWIGLFVYFAALAWILNVIFKPKTFFGRSMVGLAAILIGGGSYFFKSELIFRLGR